MFTVDEVITHLLKSYHFSFAKDDYNYHICYDPETGKLSKWIQVGLPVFSCPVPYVKKYKEMCYNIDPPIMDESEVFRKIYNKEKISDLQFRMAAENLTDQINNYISSLEQKKIEPYYNGSD